MTTKKGGGSGSGTGGFPPQRPARAPIPPPQPARRPQLRPIPGASTKPPMVRPSVRSVNPPVIAPPGAHRVPVIPDQEDEGDDDATSVMERPTFDSAGVEPVFPPPGRPYRPPNQPAPLPAAGRPAHPTRPEIDIVPESERNRSGEGTMVMPNAPVRAPPPRGRTDKIPTLDPLRRGGGFLPRRTGEGSQAGRAPREGSQASRPPRGDGSQVSRAPRETPSVPSLDALLPAQRPRGPSERPHPTTGQRSRPPTGDAASLLARPPQVAHRLGQTTAPFPPNPPPPNANETLAMPHAPWTPAPPPVLSPNYPPTPHAPPVQPIPRGHHPSASASAPHPMYPGSVPPDARMPTNRPPPNRPPASRSVRPSFPSLAPHDMTGSLSVVGLMPAQPPGIFGFVLFAAPLALATAAIAALALL